MGLVKVKTSNSLKHLDLKDALEILGGRDLKHSYFGTHLQIQTEKGAVTCSYLVSSQAFCLVGWKNKI